MKSQFSKEHRELNMWNGALMVCFLSVTGCAQTGLLSSQESAPIESRSPSTQASQPQSRPPAPVQAVIEEPVVNISPLDDEDLGSPIPIGERDVALPESSPVQRPALATTSPSNPATEQILGDAQAALIKGDLHAAESVTNRGLRIAPKDPALWLQLAKIRLGQGEYSEAISLSERAQVLAVNNPAAQIDALEIIATAQDSVGESEKAAATREKIQTLSGEMGVH